jgi:hypothetical protein
MFQTHSHRRCVVAAAITTVACLMATPASRAQESQQVTLALIFDALGGTVEDAPWVTDPVCVLFNPGAEDNASTDNSAVSASANWYLAAVSASPYWSPANGVDLYDISARYVWKGQNGRVSLAKVYVCADGESQAIPLHPGVMLLGPTSDTEILGAYYCDKGTYYTPHSYALKGTAQYLIVFVRGTVH